MERLIQSIICKDLSRFGRNYIQVGQYTDYIFPMYNIRFIALNDNVDTFNNSTGMNMMPIMNIFNEWNSANTSKKIRAVIEANAKAGKYRTTYAPYGYVKGTDEKKLPVVDEPAASNVKRIFEMRASGISPKHIAILMICLNNLCENAKKEDTKKKVIWKCKARILSKIWKISLYML